MRDIARELDVPVMTLYNYVSNKEHLGELLVDHILRPVRVPGDDEGTWHERIRTLERDARQALARHRGISLRTGGVRSTEAMRLANGVVSILTASGFTPDAAARAFAVLYTFMIGQIDVDTYTDAARDMTEPTFEGITSTTGASFDELFEFGFDVVLTGLEVVLQKQDKPNDRTSR